SPALLHLRAPVAPYSLERDELVAVADDEPVRGQDVGRVRDAAYLDDLERDGPPAVAALQAGDALRIVPEQPTELLFRGACSFSGRAVGRARLRLRLLRGSLLRLLLPGVVGVRPFGVRLVAGGSDAAFEQRLRRTGE